MAGYARSFERCLSLLVAPSLLLLVLSTDTFGQGATGTLSGTVKDEQGGVIPGATITMISERQGTISAPVVTNASGDFVMPNLAADVYTVRVEMPLFKTLSRTGVAVTAGSNVTIGILTLEIGGAAEVVSVTSEAPLLQATTGERSFEISTDSVNNLPLASRSHLSLLDLAPGIQGTNRIGGGGDNNFMLDGANAMDPGVNRAASSVSIEAIQEVKVATSGYQAEYGRASGLQINAVTRSGTNQFRGSLYDAERHSRWNSKSKQQILLNQPKTVQDERDWGVAVGGPVGKPGGRNKLFFFVNYERNPRTRSANPVDYRFPTLLERQGDFSRTTDNNGNLYPYIRDPLLPGACNATSQVACFADGGVLGRIPVSRLYGPGMAILNWFPLPQTELVPGGNTFNYSSDFYSVKLLGYQPLIRLDYQPTTALRGSFRYFMYQQPNTPIRGTLPGWNDSREDDYGIYTPSASVTYTVNSTTFIEGTWGGSYHHQEGCSVSGGAPNFCTGALRTNDAANRFLSGMGGIPYIFPNATLLDAKTWSYQVLNRVDTTQWDGERIVAVPLFTWAGRVANSPPNNNGVFGPPGPSSFIIDTRMSNFTVNATKLFGPHTVKVGYYYGRSRQHQANQPVAGSISFQNDTNNPLDTSFPFANAALGVFNTYTQVSRWAEGAFLAINHEAFVQDNWKLARGLTLDYGVRFVNQHPMYDIFQNNSNFVPEQFNLARAQRIYMGTCAVPVTTANCATANLRAVDPGTGTVISENANLLIGTIVPGSGDPLNGLTLPGENGTPKTGYTNPALRLAPRFGMAWDVNQDQRLVVRGAVGVFYDRPRANTVYLSVQNPPFTENATLRYGVLSDLSTAVAPKASPRVVAYQEDLPLPQSTQWSAGAQIAVPFNTVLDVAYTGQTSENSYAGGEPGVEINNINLGTAYRADLKDPTRAATTPANSLVNTNPASLRPFRGYERINQVIPWQWQTYHSLQVGLNRRMSSGLQFTFADTITLYNKGSGPARIDNHPDGTYSFRADQERADELLGVTYTPRHVMKGSFVWMLPKMQASGASKRVLAAVVNGWSLSGVWQGTTAGRYAVNASYQSGGGNLELTGSPDYAARVIVLQDGVLDGCSGDLLRQFDTSLFKGPVPGSDGLESGNGYMSGCAQTSTDFAIARTFALGGGRRVEVRFDLFNAFNQAAITGRQTTMQLQSPTDQGQILNLPFNADGSVIPSRTLPNNSAGFGVATGFQNPRTAQLHLRLSF